MAFTLADIKRVSPQMIRDVATALGKQAESLNDIKNSFPTLPHVGSWSGEGANAANDGLVTLGGYMGGHADGRAAAAAKMRQAADEYEGLQDRLKNVEQEAQGKFTIDYVTGEITPTGDKPDVTKEAEITAALKQIQIEGETADTDLTHAVNLADGTEKPTALPSSLPDTLATMDRPHLPQESQEAAFRQVFNRAPTTPEDWQTAAMLDPHNYDPKYHGANSDIRVARIQPHPGKGQVRMGLLHDEVTDTVTRPDWPVWS